MACGSVPGMIIPPPAISYSDLPPADSYVGEHEQGEIELTGADGGKPVAAQVVFANRYITILEDCVVFPNGTSDNYMRIFENAALAARQSIVLVPTWVSFSTLSGCSGIQPAHGTLSCPADLPNLARLRRRMPARELEGRTWRRSRELYRNRDHCSQYRPARHPGSGIPCGTAKSAAKTNIPAQPGDGGDLRHSDASRTGFLTDCAMGNFSGTAAISCGFTLSAMMLALARGIVT